jgi:hypothetical protein
MFRFQYTQFQGLTHYFYFCIEIYRKLVRDTGTLAATASSRGDTRQQSPLTWHTSWATTIAATTNGDIHNFSYLEKGDAWPFLAVRSENRFGVVHNEDVPEREGGPQEVLEGHERGVARQVLQLREHGPNVDDPVSISRLLRVEVLGDQHFQLAAAAHEEADGILKKGKTIFCLFLSS